MFIRLWSGRRLQMCLKIGTVVLMGVCYFAFLFRESLNAYEYHERATTSELDKSEFTEPSKQHQNLKRQQPHRQRTFGVQRNKVTIADRSSTAINDVSAVVSTLNPVYEYSEELHSQTERQLSLRREHLTKVCRYYKLREKYPPNPWEFFISPGHNNLVWCNVFKAASSTWMYYFNILAGYDVNYLQRTEVQPLELARQRYPRPRLSELLELLPSAMSFLFVRDPFERIVSAYRNKLEGNRNSYYKALGTKIVYNFRQRIWNAGYPRSGPTFEEFVRFLISEHNLGRQFDEHWAPVYSFCTPCSVNFSVIGKTETFQRDSDFIIRQAGLESLLLANVWRKRMHNIGSQGTGIKSAELVERYFGELDRLTLDQLLNIYKIDFELFDYDYLKYFNMVHSWNLEQSIASARRNGGPTTTVFPASFLISSLRTVTYAYDPRN